MDHESAFFTPSEARGITDVTALLRDGREEILRDWLERVRVNQTVQAGQALPDPLLLDHVPQLFDAILDRLEVNRPRDEAEQAAVVHGFARRISGYNVAETVLELLMFRRAIWAHLVAAGARPESGYAAMEQIDGMVDRAILSSLQAFLDPDARMLERSGKGSPDPSGG